jgi:hypothetical protein
MILTFQRLGLTGVVFERVVVGEVGDGGVDFNAFLGTGHDAFSVNLGQRQGGWIGRRRSVLVLRLLGNVDRFWGHFEASPIWDEPISHDSFLTARPFIQAVVVLPVAV